MAAREEKCTGTVQMTYALQYSIDETGVAGVVHALQPELNYTVTPHKRRGSRELLQMLQSWRLNGVQLLDQIWQQHHL